MPIKERILQVADYKGIAKSLFCKKIGSTYGNFTGENKNRPINSDCIANLLSICPDISPEWLLTGKGPMLKSTADTAQCDDSNNIQHTVSNESSELIKELLDRITEQAAEIGALKREIEYLENMLKKTVGDAGISGVAAAG